MSLVLSCPIHRSSLHVTSYSETLDCRWHLLVISYHQGCHGSIGCVPKKIYKNQNFYRFGNLLRSSFPFLDPKTSSFYRRKMAGERRSGEKHKETAVNTLKYIGIFLYASLEGWEMGCHGYVVHSRTPPSSREGMMHWYILSKHLDSDWPSISFGNFQRSSFPFIDPKNHLFICQIYPYTGY
jgi:hypothetical protein